MRITGLERTVHMLCIVDKSLSVLRTLRMCLRVNSVVFFGYFTVGILPLSKDVLLINVFIMALFGDS